MITPPPWRVEDRRLTHPTMGIKSGGEGLLIQAQHAGPGSSRNVATVNSYPHESVEDDARLLAAAPELLAALIEAKQELWRSARADWTMADFKNWAVVQRIDAALEKADGLPRS
jgi:hypothetical protein